MKSIVIGSGFGGISAALRLRAKGHEVTLIEKQNDLGGRARIFRKNGFSFDAGPTVITAPYLIYELFELFGKDPKDYLNIKPLDIWYQFVFEDGTKFNYSGNEEEMEKQISAISPDDLKGYVKLVNFTKKIFEKGSWEWTMWYPKYGPMDSVIPGALVFIRRPTNCGWRTTGRISGRYCIA